MRIDRTRVIDAPVSAVWNAVCDPSRYPEVLGFGQWEPRGDQTTGVGARYRLRLPVGSIVLGGEVEVVESDDRCELAWNSVTGVEQRGRWRLRATPDGGTKVTLRMAYQAPGGILGLMADYVAAFYVRRLLDQALDSVVEHVAGTAHRR
jgi:uncharacterized membrane protein